MTVTQKTQVVPATPGTRPRKSRGRARFSGIPYVIPSFLALALVSIAPIAMALYFSFTNFGVLRGGEFVGVDNYARMLQDSTFHLALRNTAIYTVICVTLQTVLSLLVADFIAKFLSTRSSRIVRAVLFIPVVSSMVLVGMVWRAIFATDGGFVNQVLQLLGADGANWLGSPNTALIIVALVTVWKNIGYFLVIYYAGILGVPRDRYEAARVDGAGYWQQLWYITIPSLRPITILVVILGTIWSFQVFDLVFTMTGGGPGGGTITLVMAIYQSGFENFQMGYASAMAMFLFVLVLITSIIQRRLLAREN